MREPKTRKVPWENASDDAKYRLHRVSNPLAERQTTHADPRFILLWPNEIDVLWPFCRNVLILVFYLFNAQTHTDDNRTWITSRNGDRRAISARFTNQNENRSLYDYRKMHQFFWMGWCCERRLEVYPMRGLLFRVMGRTSYRFGWCNKVLFVQNEIKDEKRTFDYQWFEWQMALKNERILVDS